MIRKSWASLVCALMFGAVNTHASVTAKGLNASDYTSDYMIGSVVVSVIFPESDGTIDGNSENWSEDRKSQVVSQIMAGLNWWTQQNPRSPLSFTVVSRTIATKYEPILHPYYDEALWIPDIMSKLGYTGNRWTSTRAYVNDLRQQYKTDWGYVIFVVDSLNDADGKFNDGLFAYTYLGGPFVVMTYDNNGYGISNMSVVAAHETGHIFYALDQYAGASGPNDYSNGYFPTVNGNHAYSSIANEPTSIMRGGLRWGLDDWTRKMIGWRDSDNNGRDDVFDPTPTTSVAQQPSGSSAPGTTAFSGQTAVNVLARQGNAQGYGLTVDTIAKVEYRLKNGTWSTAIPTDGVFDGPQEAFQITVSAGATSAQSISTQDLELRVTTSFATKNGGSTLSGGAAGPPASTLDNAHAFPNPYKPNSNIGHTDVIFTNLTAGAKVQIFTVAGEPVYSKDTPAGTNQLHWTAINDDGSLVASGVYYFLITDNAGHKKTGKVAVIR